MIRLLAKCFVLIGVAACGGADPTSVHDSLTVIADPTSITLAAGETGTIELLLERTGAATDVTATLTVSGVPAAVTATFDAATTTGDFATLTISAGPAAAQGTSALAVTASTGAITASTTATLTIQPPGHITTH